LMLLCYRGKRIPAFALIPESVYLYALDVVITPSLCYLSMS
jgi:hypothetical protein